MVNIKQKKQLNLPQLIEWGFNNPKEVESKIFESDNIDYFSNTAHVQFSNDGCGVRMSSSVTVNDTFTVEVGKEITEDTRLDELVVRYRNDDIYIFPQERINDFKNDSSIVAFYIPNDDLTLTLIWRDGKFIE